MLNKCSPLFLFFSYFLLFSVALGAQTEEGYDYMLFRPGVQYLYEYPDGVPQGGYVSTKILGQRISLGSTEVDGPIELYASFKNEDSGTIFRRAPSFAGYRMLFDAARTELFFSTDNDTDKLLILNAASLGETWEATPGITAEVIGWEEADFWDLRDSVKTIQFYATDNPDGTTVSIRISQDYGLLNALFFEDLFYETSPLSLVSMSEPERGPQLPTVNELLLPPAGTTLSHLRGISIQTSPDPSSYRSIDTLKNFEILTSEFNPATGERTVTYRLEQMVQSRRNVPNAEPFNFRGRDTLFGQWRFDPSYAAMFDLQPGELFAVPEESETVSILYGEIDPCFGVGLGRSYEGFRATVDPNYYQVGTDAFNFGLHYLYAAGPYYDFGFSSRNNLSLTSVINSNIECGIPWDFSVSIQSFITDNRVALSPNPATEWVQLDIPFDLAPKSYRLINVSGQSVAAGALARGVNRIPLTNLPSGFYSILVAFTNGTGLVRRVVVN